MNQLERSTSIVRGDVLVAFDEAYQTLRDCGDDRLKSLLGQSPLVTMTAIEDWKIRLELMAFLLQVVDRQAFASGGANARDRLQQGLVPRLAADLVALSWPNGEASFAERLTNETLHNLGVAEQEYGVCASLFSSDEGFTGFMDDSAVFGRFLANLGATNSPGFLLLLYQAVVKALVTSNLSKRVEFEADLLRDR